MFLSCVHFISHISIDVVNVALLWYLEIMIRANFLILFRLIDFIVKVCGSLLVFAAPISSSILLRFSLE